MVFKEISQKLKDRAKKIKLICFDVDGVLTNGDIFIGKEGEHFKQFSAFDGLGIRMAQQFGLETAIISARDSVFPHVRFKDLGMEEIHTAVADKMAKLKEIQEKLGITMEQTAFIGDDAVDITVLEKVGLSGCPPEAHYSVFKHIHYITERGAGKGCAREFIDLVLYCQGNIPA